MQSHVAARNDKKLRRCRRRSGCFSSAHQRIDAPAAGAVENDEEKEPRVKHGWLAMILNWKKSTRCVGHEITDSHFAAGNESGETGQKSECDQKSANQLDPRSDDSQHLRRHAVPARREAKNFLAAVTGKH